MYLHQGSLHSCVSGCCRQLMMKANVISSIESLRSCQLYRKDVHFSHGIQGFNALCACCNLHMETHTHLFRDCSFANNIWTSVFVRNITPAGFDFQKFYDLNWHDWINFNLSKAKNWKVWFTVIIWHIWNVRNNAVFRGFMNHPNHVLNKILNDFNLVSTAFHVDQIDANQGVQSSFAWKLPEVGRHKLNVDASYQGEGRASGGGVVRDDHGRWVSGFSVKFFAQSPSEAELIAVRFGIEFTKALNISIFDLETDALEIHSLLTSGQNFDHHYLAPVLQDVDDYLKSNPHVQFVHAPREMNKVAHGLALFGRCMACDNVVHSSPPDLIMMDYEVDRKGKGPVV